MTYASHRQQSAHRPVACAIITASDTRTPETDTSGSLLRHLLTAAGHTVNHYEILPDDPAKISAACQTLAAVGNVQTILINGGTGISRRDGTFEAVAGLLTRTLPGFGELFRMLSWQQVKSGAMLSRAIAGVIDAPAGPVLLFSMPGSPNAVEVAAKELIIPELSHLAWELTK